MGHEYRLADGERIGYYGHGVEGAPFNGCIRYDNIHRIEAQFPADSTHFHSNDLNLIVGDGFPWVLLCGSCYGVSA
ncbi:MAG: hypothetical protein ACUVSY_14505, partial [Roseiflexus sp.]